MLTRFTLESMFAAAAPDVPVDNEQQTVNDYPLFVIHYQ
jgi:hypothetical protein